MSSSWWSSTNARACAANNSGYTLRNFMGFWPLGCRAGEGMYRIMRLWFWNNHQEVIHLVALHKVILFQQGVARLRCLTQYNVA